MATYNGAKYIREQLDSLAAQTLLPYELVVTDDGSMDRTLEIVAEFSADAPFPIKVYVNMQRLGYRDNFLKAAGLCSGDLVAFCDQDDFWQKEKLERCIQPFRSETVQLCMHSGSVWDGERKLGFNSPDFSKKQVLPAFSINPFEYERLGFAMVFRKRLLEFTSGLDRPRDFHDARYPMAHDQWVWFLASIFGEIALIPDCLVLYRQHLQNTFGAVKAIKPSILAAVYKSVSTNAYFNLAREDFKTARMFRDLEGLGEVTYSRQSAKAAKLFRQRGRYQLLRHRIYQKQLSYAGRIISFCAILKGGGYWGSSNKMRPGLKAMVKDLTIAILKIHILAAFLQNTRRNLFTLFAVRFKIRSRAK